MRGAAAGSTDGVAVTRVRGSHLADKALSTAPRTSAASGRLLMTIDRQLSTDRPKEQGIVRYALPIQGIISSR